MKRGFLYFLLLILSINLFSQNNLVVHNVYFDIDKDNASITELISLKEKIKIENILSIKLSGFTDSIGSLAYNLDLSKRRVLFIKEYLVSNGMEEKIISTSYFGEKNNNDLNIKHNRRVSIQINYAHKKDTLIDKKIKNKPINVDYDKINTFLKKGEDIQTFKIPVSQASTIQTKDGIILSFQANSFKSSCSDTIRIELTEYNDKSSMFFGNMSTTSFDKLIFSHGMFYVKAFCGKEELKIKKNITYTVLVPKINENKIKNDNIENQAFLFYGEYNNIHNEINWVKNDQKLEVINFNTLNDSLNRKKVCFLINMFSKEDLNGDYKNPKKIKKNVEKKLKANFDQLNSIDKKSVEFYVLNPNSLGYINCDAFWGIDSSLIVNQKIILKEKNLNNIKIQIVFEGKRSIMNSSSNFPNFSTFNKIQKDLKAKVVALKINENVIELAIKEFVTGQDVVLSEFKKVNSFAELQELMKNIN